jgi:hypothetical protein
MLSLPYANNILAKIYQNTPFTLSSYLGLHVGDPGTTGANELSGTGYARLALSPSHFTTPAGTGQISNTTAMTFLNLPTGTVAYFGVWDALTGGTFVQGGLLTQAQGVGPTVAFIVSAHMLVLQFSDAPQLTDITTYVRNKILDYMYRQVDFTTSPIFASLHASSPGQGGASELVGLGYARQQVPFSNPASGLIVSSADMVFTNLPAGDIGYLGGFDQLTGGNFIMGAQLYVAGVPGVAHMGNGDNLAFLAGTYSVSAD